MAHDSEHMGGTQCPRLDHLLIECRHPVNKGKVVLVFRVKVMSKCPVYENINEISEAITKLKNDSTYREMLAKGALKKSASLTIEKRAVDILEWMKTMGEIKE